jgi:ActR/RegA family two-component response regulator
MREILIIEDNFGLRESYKRALQRHGFVCATATTARQAIDLLNSVEFDHVICDFQLDQGTGGDVHDWLKENRPDQLEKFTFVCGFTSDVAAYGLPVIAKAGLDICGEIIERIEAAGG